MIAATNLSKQFGNHTAVDGFSITVEEGEIFGLLGPNAAGKTTVMRMLCGILKSDNGNVNINGMSIEKARTHFGYVAQHFGQYEELSVWENLKFYASMYRVTHEPTLLALLNRYNLIQFRDQLAGALSGGYQRRLALACALAHDPTVLFLDEPTAGIDPVTRKLLWDDFYRLSAEGKTLFVTTHYMEEAQRCHNLAFMSLGKKVAQGTPESIKLALGDVKVFNVKLPYQPGIREALLKIKGIILVNQFGNELRVVVHPEVTVETLQASIASVTEAPCALSPCEPNLEDVFIALTQEKLPNDTCEQRQC